MLSAQSNSWTSKGGQYVAAPKNRSGTSYNFESLFLLSISPLMINYVHSIPVEITQFWTTMYQVYLREIRKSWTALNGPRSDYGFLS